MRQRTCVISWVAARLLCIWQKNIILLSYECLATLWLKEYESIIIIVIIIIISLLILEKLTQVETSYLVTLLTT